MHQAELFSCPNCAASLKYDPAKKLWNCDSCDSTFKREDLNIPIDENDMSVDMSFRGRSAAVSTAPSFSFTFGESENGYINEDIISWSHIGEGVLKPHECPSCGSAFISEVKNISVVCPYCHNNAVLKGNLTGTYCPQLMIPFRVSRKAAEDLIISKINSEIADKNFAKAVDIKQMTGIYVPFWLLDCEVDYHITGTTSTDRLSPADLKGNKEYRHVAYCYGGCMGFESIPLDASLKMNDNLMEAISPFEWNRLQPFDSSYFSGFLADVYDLPANEVVPRAAKLLKDSADSAMSSRFPYMVEKFTTTDHRIKTISARLCYLPVWQLSVNYKGKQIQLVVNGDVAKFAGSIPIAKGARLKFKLKKMLPLLAVSYVGIWILLLIFGNNIPMSNRILIYFIASIFLIISVYIYFGRRLNGAFYEKQSMMRNIRSMRSVASYLRTRSSKSYYEKEVFIEKGEKVNWDKYEKRFRTNKY